MAMNNGLRSFSSKFMNSSRSLSSKPVAREFHSSGVKVIGGGHGHDEPYHMYNLDRIKY